MKPNTTEPLVNSFTAQHGDYREGFMPDPDTENQRTRLVRTVLNRGGSAVERWIHEQDSKLFGRPQVEAVRHCQRLWARIDYHASITNSSGIPSNGETEQDARDELHDYQRRLPRKYWDVYENIVRFEMPAGVSGCSIANNSRTSVEASKIITAFVASLIAQWRGL